MRQARPIALDPFTRVEKFLIAPGLHPEAHRVEGCHIVSPLPKEMPRDAGCAPPMEVPRARCRYAAACWANWKINPITVMPTAAAAIGNRILRCRLRAGKPAGPGVVIGGCPVAQRRLVVGPPCVVRAPDPRQDQRQHHGDEHEAGDDEEEIIDHAFAGEAPRRQRKPRRERDEQCIDARMQPLGHRPLSGFARTGRVACYIHANLRCEAAQSSLRLDKCEGARRVPCVPVSQRSAHGVRGETDAAHRAGL